ncbi:hypothetical protein CEXT_761991 [Caerostris extrusa]|uniref:Uncharacterized protein n=1 Tax=Caerostris extrusa TaxID=172846 RepID=A0AAV4MXP2_CAEEX|nr:hypothetical protein CEXT_761991 [Caerostris extrusa]
MVVWRNQVSQYKGHTHGGGGIKLASTKVIREWCEGIKLASTKVIHERWCGGIEYEVHTRTVVRNQVGQYGRPTRLKVIKLASMNVKHEMGLGDSYFEWLSNLWIPLPSKWIAREILFIIGIV